MQIILHTLLTCGSTCPPILVKGNTLQEVEAHAGNHIRKGCLQFNFWDFFLSLALSFLFVSYRSSILRGGDIGAKHPHISSKPDLAVWPVLCQPYQLLAL